MKVLLSIKPKYADKIFTGEKKYEFRKSIFKDKNVKTVVVYSSSPIQKVIGEFEIELIIKDEIDKLWELTKEQSGIEKNNFFDYFKNKEQGYAIKIKTFQQYSAPQNLRQTTSGPAPQSFKYLK